MLENEASIFDPSVQCSMLSPDARLVSLSICYIVNVDDRCFRVAKKKIVRNSEKTNYPALNPVEIN